MLNKQVEVILVGIQRIDRGIREEAYDNCTYRNKCSEKCYRDRECRDRKVVSLFWARMASLN